MEKISLARPRLLDEIGALAAPTVHLILIATKPDIIKQVPLYLELKRRDHAVLLGHTGQHYDENLSGGMLKEFDVRPDFNLNVRGAMHEVVSQIISRFGWVLGEIKDRGKTVIPYVHGDTTTAMAGSNAGYCHGFASVHGEAGIRTLTPAYEGIGDRGSGIGKGSGSGISISDPAEWRKFCMERKHWQRGSQEPFPEQFNTRCSEAATGIHLAPVELDREFLLSEGYADDRIFVVGNSVADAMRLAQKQAGKATVFDRFPLLREGNFVRYCIHRRENCMSALRFMSIMDSMRLLLQEGRTVLLISLFQTESAIDRFGLRTEVEEWRKKYPHFIYSPVWPLYTDVVAAMERAAVCATDSGSMQEEMNVLSVPCVTLRFGSDRSESAMAGGNLIAPPVDGGLIRSMIDFAWGNADMRAAPKLYGDDVSRKCVDIVEQVLKKGPVFRSEEERLKING